VSNPPVNGNFDSRSVTAPLPAVGVCNFVDFPIIDELTKNDDEIVRFGRVLDFFNILFCSLAFYHTKSSVQVNIPMMKMKFPN
jgi:hypothetical protein